MSDPQNLPDLLQARLKLGLANWFRRTLLWSAVLALFSTWMPFFKVLLIGWLIFSGISLAGLLLGLKLARHLKSGSAGVFTADRMGDARDAGGVRRESGEAWGTLDEEDVLSGHRPPSGRAVSDEIIEIEAEVLPPEER